MMEYGVHMKQLAAYQSPPRVPVALTRTGFSKRILKSRTFLVGLKIGFPINLDQKQYNIQFPPAGTENSLINYFSLLPGGDWYIRFNGWELYI